LASLDGPYDPFVSPPLPPASPWLDVLLQEHARSYAEREQLRADLIGARMDAAHLVNVRRLKIRAYKTYRRVLPRG
jgi:hypothetical protein